MGSEPFVASIGRALPAHHYNQEQLTQALTRIWGPKLHNPERLASLHRHVAIGGRYLTLPLEELAELKDFGAANDVFIREGHTLGAAALREALGRAALVPEQIDHIFFVTVTGLSTPSLDALISNRLGLRPDIKRTPIFGLGCVAGAAGLARAYDYARAYPQQVVALVSVELCSLTLQQKDLSIANMLASGLFGDGAAAALICGSDVKAARGPRIVATHAVLYPNTENLLGWRVTTSGFGIVLGAELPDIVEQHIGADVDALLGKLKLRREDIATYICHPGGPKVFSAVERALSLAPTTLDGSRRSLHELGNVSSASVLMILRDMMEQAAHEKDSYTLLMALGPGFCAEMVLLQW